MKPPTELPRRFYKAADTGPDGDGFSVRLDGRVPKSPRGKPLVLPTETLARLVAAEWAAQSDLIRIATMPATRLANTALDAVPTARDETAYEIARYAGSDVLCYQATHPSPLVRRQREQWNPILDWARETLGVALVPTTGITHQPQSPEAIARLEAIVAEADDFTLAGLAFATGLYGSAILALAVWRRHLTGEAAFDLSRLDETFQEEQWGVDVEAAARTARLRADAQMLESWFGAL